MTEVRTNAKIVDKLRVVHLVTRMRTWAKLQDTPISADCTRAADAIEDLVKALRWYASADAGRLVQSLRFNPGSYDGDMRCDAADTIEQLVEALRWYASADAWTRHQLEDSDGDYGRRAREALTRFGVKL